MVRPPSVSGLCGLLLLFSSAAFADSTIGPASSTPFVSPNGAVAHESWAFDGNDATSANMTVSRPWTYGAGLDYAGIEYFNFPAYYTPVSLRVKYWAYVDGWANCPGRIKLQYYDGSWHDLATGEDAASGSQTFGPLWTSPVSLVGVAGSGIVKVRGTVEAEIGAGGCGLGGSAAYLSIYEIELAVNTCAKPINFGQSGSGSGAGIVTFNYSFQSSTGRLSDLAACSLHETLTHNPSPYASPPFAAGTGTPSPTTISFGDDLTDGNLTDSHWPPGGSFVQPYIAATATVDQLYEYSCPCFASGAHQVISGPYTILRVVSQNPDGSWKYTVTKSGVTATINPLPQ